MIKGWYSATTYITTKNQKRWRCVYCLVAFCSRLVVKYFKKCGWYLVELCATVCDDLLSKCWTSRRAMACVDPSPVFLAAKRPPPSACRKTVPRKKEGVMRESRGDKNTPGSGPKPRPPNNSDNYTKQICMQGCNKLWFAFYWRTRLWNVSYE